MSEQEHDDAEAPGGGLVARSIEEFVHQLRSFTDRARDLAGAAVPSGFSLPALPSPPGAMSAAQLRAIAQMVQGQRAQTAALIANLQAYDQQLAVFERILEPLVEWSATWARLEEGVAGLVRRDGGTAEADRERPAKRAPRRTPTRQPSESRQPKESRQQPRQAGQSEEPGGPED